VERPPSPDRDGRDPKTVRKAYLLLGTLLGAGMLGGLAQGILDGASSATLVTYGLGALVCAAMLELTRRGRTRWAFGVLVTGMTVIGLAESFGLVP
jgi:hypothetical protein